MRGWALGAGCTDQPERVGLSRIAEQGEGKEGGWANLGSPGTPGQVSDYWEDSEEPCEVFSRKVPSKR